MSNDISVALDLMDDAWPGYSAAKTAIRAHVEALEAAVLCAHWSIWKDGDVEQALKVLAGTGIVPTRPLMARGGKKPLRKARR